MLVVVSLLWLRLVMWLLLVDAGRVRAGEKLLLLGHLWDRIGGRVHVHDGVTGHTRHNAQGTGARHFLGSALTVEPSCGYPNKRTRY
jgi:hypothetical protein